MKTWFSSNHLNSLTISAWNACKVGRLPTKSCRDCFGISTIEHSIAIKDLIDRKKIVPMDLHTRKQNGIAITALVKENGGSIVFITLIEFALSNDIIT